MAMQEQRILRIFEKRLLEELGYRLLLDEEAGSGRPVEGEMPPKNRLKVSISLLPPTWA